MRQKVLGILLLIGTSQSLFGQHNIANQLFESIHRNEDNNIDSVLFHVNELIKIQDQLSDSLKLESYLLIGQMYDDASLHELAFQFYEKALDLIDSNDPRISFLYSEIGEMFTSFEDFENARKYLIMASQKELIIESSSKNKAALHYDWGTFYWYIGKYDSAIFSLKQATNILKTAPRIDYNFLKVINCELAEVYCYANLLTQAESILNEASNYPDSIAYTKYTENYYKYAKGLLHKHKQEFEDGVRLMEEVFESIYGLQEEQSNLAQHLIDMFVKTNNYKRAFEYQQIREQIEKQMINDRNKRRIAALEIIHETEKKDQTIASQLQTISNRNLILLITGIAVTVILIFLGLLIKSRNSIQKKNIKIETLMRELHHRVKNNLQVISSLLGLQSLKMDDDKAKQAIEEGKNRVKAMSMIHQRLYKGEEVSSINFREYASNLAEELKQTYAGEQDINLNIEIPDIELDVDTTSPLGLILNELITNSFKYAFEHIKKPTISIILKFDDHTAVLDVSDNGHGLPENLDIYTNDSFGLKLVNILVKQLKGKIAIFSEAGLTYRITFEI